ncbi:MAG: aldo/keto reductase [Lachnospiraceae bacterium]|nr:aldo/keto reductase [Lachnospiraceae bacterium]MDD5853788.1 aldo/keto reductase [Lachnospiraceae bacterium]
MLYRKDRKGNEISQLGFGCMRFTRKGNAIDFDKAEKEVMQAVHAGVNYFDTAYIYTGSEELMGKIFKKNGVREQIHIATKLPQYMLRSIDAVEKTFKEELKRLQTDYIDYYLMHMFTDIHEWENLKHIGIEDWIAGHLADGSIRNIGFSYHGDPDMFLKILNAYNWDFCQIQYNYLDEHSQAGRRGLEVAHEKGIPVIIMEPLRGGKLVNMLPKEAHEAIEKSERGYTAAEWGLRWLWNQPGVTCVLSGMNSSEMVAENIRIASDMTVDQFTEADFETIEEIKKAIRKKEKVGCTGCRYCMPCPKGVDIPGIFHYYNLSSIEKKSTTRMEFARNMGLRKDSCMASQCIKCGKCEKHCPQHIAIREKLQEADKVLRPAPYKVGIEVARKIMVNKRNLKKG